MQTNNNRPAPGQGFLRRHRKVLLTSVFGLGVLGVAMGEGFVPAPATPAIAAAVGDMTGQEPGGFADIIDRVKPAVVSVKVKVDASADDDDGGDQSGPGPQFNMPDVPPDSPLYRFFHQFGFGDQDGSGQGNMHRPHKQFGMAQGSGFFISADGYIVTNNHVVDHATEVDVVTDGGKTLTAKVIGTDPKTDLALIKVTDGGDFPFVALSDRTPRVGDWVLAVGNPFGLGGTVTAGIVSARGRDIGSGPYDDFIQIDAPVNRGNSGGPTFNTNGEVIGVNTAIFSPSGGSVGIGFDIPADTVKRVVAELKDHGKVTRGWIGVQIQPVTADIADSIGLKTASGAIVSDVTKDGPAAKAGIQTGDAITAVNGQSVADPRELARAVAAIKPGEDASVTVWRDGGEKTISIPTGTLPGDQKHAEAAQPDQQDTQPSSLANLGLKLEPAENVAGAGHVGVVVTDVDPDGAAADRLQTGDVIVDVAGKPVKTVADVRDGIAAVRSEGRKSVLLRVKSGDTVHFVALSLAKA